MSLLLPGSNRAFVHAIEDIEREGYVIAPGAIADAQVKAIASELEPHFAKTPRCEGDFYGWQTTRLGGLLSKAPLTRALVLHRDILAIVEALLSPSCDCIQLNLTQAIRVHAGERAQAPHRDEEMWPLEPKGRPWLINVMWPLTDFTEANGATRLWAGSHRHELDRSLDPNVSRPAAMRAGSALIFLGSLTHGAGANMAGQARDGIIVSYCLGWLKQYENQFLAYPPDVARAFPVELQKLIGYRMHRPNLGGVEGQDPIRALDALPRPAMAHADALTPEIARQLKTIMARAPEPSAPDRAYQEIRARVLGGIYRLRERLDVGALAGDLGVSATPVREALLRLNGERLVALRPAKGFSVWLWTEAELRELYRWRGLLTEASLKTWTPAPFAEEHQAIAYAGRVRATLGRLLDGASGELVRAAFNADDRLTRARFAEFDLWPDADAELSALVQALAQGSSKARYAIVAYHERRAQSAKDIRDRAALRDLPDNGG